MAIDERSRHELFVRLEQVLGSQEAATLMEHLPPVGWADVATKRDVEALSFATKRDLEALEGRLLATFRAEFRAELISLQRHMTSICIGSMVGLAGLAFAAARLV